MDVGGVYSPETHRYDHHQRGFDEVFGNGFDKIKLSSAGLVYKFDNDLRMADEQAFWEARYSEKFGSSG